MAEAYIYRVIFSKSMLAQSKIAIFTLNSLFRELMVLQTIWIGLLQKCGTNGEKYFWRKSEPIKGLHWNFCKETTSRARVTGNIANLLDFDQNYIAIAIVIELFQLLNMS